MSKEFVEINFVYGINEAKIRIEGTNNVNDARKVVQKGLNLPADAVAMLNGEPIDEQTTTMNDIAEKGGVAEFAKKDGGKA